MEVWNIKFDDAELKRIYERVDELTEEVKNANDGNFNAFNGIIMNVQTQTMTETLQEYRDFCNTVTNDLVNYLNNLKDYLNTKIQTYNAIDTEAQEQLRAVTESLLNKGYIGKTNTTASASPESSSGVVGGIK